MKDVDEIIEDCDSDEEDVITPLPQEKYTAEVYGTYLTMWLDKFEKLAFDSKREALSCLKDKLQTYIAHIDKTLAVIE